MTSIHPTATDPSLPGPPADSAGSSPPAAVPLCSITATVEGCAAPAVAPGPPVRPNGAVRYDSVPQPRTREDAGAYAPPTADPAPSADDPTTARLREAFAERLRAARAEGRTIAELAAACRQSAEEVRALLGEGPADDSGDGTEPEVVRFRRTTTPVEGNRTVPLPRSAREELRGYGSRRPSPSRRLRRMHPQAVRTGQEATARETAATDPVGAEPCGAGWTSELTGAAGTVADHLPSAAAVAPAAGVGVGAGVGTGAGPGAEAGSGLAAGTGSESGSETGSESGSGAGSETGASRAEPPLGILIGGSPVQPEAVGRPEERTPVRVAAEPIRIGRGTSLVVLPSWRPAIAVSVSTEQLLSETGLGVEQLADAPLTVLMNPWALHDRELDLHGWEPGQSGRGRRGGARG